MVLSWVLPLGVAPLRCLPALRRFPGQTPAHEARCFALGNRAMSVPISAMIAAAVTGPVAGTVSSHWHGEQPLDRVLPLGRGEVVGQAHLDAMDRRLQIGDV